MTLRRLLPAAVAAALPLLAACDLNENLPTQLSGGTSGGQGAPFSFSDGADDILSGADPLVAPDLTTIGGTVSADTVTIRLSFARPISAYSAGAANSIDGYVELDVDESAGTGTPSYVTQLGGNPGLGVDYYVRLQDVAARQMEMVRTEDDVRIRVGVTFTATTVTLRIPRADLFDPAGDEDGRFRLAAVVGTIEGPTDVAPNSGAYRVAR